MIEITNDEEMIKEYEEMIKEYEENKNMIERIEKNKENEKMIKMIKPLVAVVGHQDQRMDYNTGAKNTPVAVVGHQDTQDPDDGFTFEQVNTRNDIFQGHVVSESDSSISSSRPKKNNQQGTNPFLLAARQATIKEENSNDVQMNNDVQVDVQNTVPVPPNFENRKRSSGQQDTTGEAEQKRPKSEKINSSGGSKTKKNRPKKYKKHSTRSKKVSKNKTRKRHSTRSKRQKKKKSQ